MPDRFDSREHAKDDSTGISDKPLSRGVHAAPATAIQAWVPPAAAAAPLLMQTCAYSRHTHLVCGSCKSLVPVDVRVPPWCPTCGADFKPQTASQPTRSAVPPPCTDGKPVPVQPPYFEGRIAGRSYRVYVIREGLLCLDCPSHDDCRSAQRMAGDLSLEGGVRGAALGSLIADRLDAEWRTGAYVRRAALDLADLQALMSLAGTESCSFRLDFADLRAVGIDALGFWERTVIDRCAARLHFWHPVRGQVAIDLPRTDDVRVAMARLSAALGEKLETDAVWDSQKQRFVPRG